MPFDSLEFFALLAATLVAYYATTSVRAQNAILLVASYICYGWMNWRWAVMLACVTAVNFAAAHVVVRSRGVLAGIIAVNLGVLATYKYFNFFAENVAAAAKVIGLSLDPFVLSLALPIGISFHVFQLIAYQVDIYRGDTKPVRDPVAFATFVVFFPQMAAGPIERANHLAVQFLEARTTTPNDVSQGLWLIVWGLFLKVVIADSMAPLVGQMFDHQASNAASLLVGALAFAVQIYCDFNAYSMMARGIAGLFGIELVWNFRYPYFATSVQDFWRRWHISLSQWLRDYLYIPLGGNRKGEARTIANLIATMGLAGLWHGAAWHFVAWGLWHGLALATERSARRSGFGRFVPALAGWLMTMAVVLLGWVLFRISDLALLGSIDRFEWTSAHGQMLWTIALMFAPVALMEAFEQLKADRFALARFPVLQASTMAVALVGVFALYGQFRVHFIYFQF